MSWTTSAQCPAQFTVAAHLFTLALNCVCTCISIIILLAHFNKQVSIDFFFFSQSDQQTSRTQRIQWCRLVSIWNSKIFLGCGSTRLVQRISIEQLVIQWVQDLNSLDSDHFHMWSEWLDLKCLHTMSCPLVMSHNYYFVPTETAAAAQQELHNFPTLTIHWSIQGQQIAQRLFQTVFICVSGSQGAKNNTGVVVKNQLLVRPAQNKPVFHCRQSWDAIKC